MVGSKSICPKWHFGEVEHGDIWGTFWSILLVKKSMFSFSVISPNLMPLHQHNPLSHKHFFHILILEHVREYSRVICILAPFSFAPTSSNTNSTFIALHLELDGYFSLFLKDYKLDQDIELSFNSFELTFQRTSHLSMIGPSGMVFEHLRDCFHPKDSTCGFPQLFQLCFHMVQGHIPIQIALVLGMAHFLAMTKPLNEIHPIIMKETSYRFTSCT